MNGEDRDAATGISTTADLTALRCTACGEPSLGSAETTWSGNEILRDAIVCQSCGTTFDVIWDTPFIGHYEPDEISGLIEIAANARADNSYPSRGDAERLEGLLRGYHEAEDKPVFVSTCADEFARAPWFTNRYTEYAAFRSLAADLEFAGRDVLDVGAGSGFDAWRLVQLGARVTALEHNPVLIQRGRSVVPEARWIGGSSHVLPFQAETFDVVCCNAALHHMRDVPAAMREMLRVLRPGGSLLTVGDPFRADDSSDDLEFEVFDRHPAVLLGVNESIPTFGELTEALATQRSAVRVTFLTSELHGRRPFWLRRLDSAAQRKWSFAAARRLAKAGGSLSIRAGVRKQLAIPPATQDRAVLRAGDYASSLVDHDAAIARLVPLLPAECVDRPFPGARQTKFELLNGWQMPQPGEAFRTGYRRARWYLTRPEGAAYLRFRARRLRAGEDATSLETYVTGSPAGAVRLSDRWQEVLVSVDAVPVGGRFACELRLAVPGPEPADFDDLRFAVADRGFVAAA